MYESTPIASWLVRRHKFDSRLEVRCWSHSLLSSQCFPVITTVQSIKGIKAWKYNKENKKNVVYVTTVVVILAVSETIDITWEVKVNMLENRALSKMHI